MPGDRYWIRDYGATFLVNGKGDLGVADFIYDRYGLYDKLLERYNHNKDSADKYFPVFLDPSTKNIDRLAGGTGTGSLRLIERREHDLGRNCTRNG